jgi:tRNA U34 5-carboxymethylaminomethyl modifying GTPase MnmE/TrmE
MNAVEVEALGDLLHAETDAQLQLCHAQARIGEYLWPTRERLIKLLARMEARFGNIWYSD